MTEESAEIVIRPDPITAGEQVPPFELPAVTESGEQITVKIPEVLEGGPVLLIFYQDDGMPLCTSELKAFAQEYQLLSEAGVQLFGINTNGLGSHAKFQERDHFPFPLISDFHGEAVKRYGFWDDVGRKSQRAAVVITPDGRVKHVEAYFNPRNLNAFEAIFEALGLM